MAAILVVVSDPARRRAVGDALAGAGHAVHADGDAARVREALRRRPVDAVVLAPGPPLDPVAVTRSLRGDGDRTPLLLLTGDATAAGRVAGLDAGADDCMAEPVALEELVARVKALLRRGGGTGAAATAGEPSDPTGPLVLGDLHLDPVTREVRRGARRLALTRTEHLLLEQLLRHPDRVLSRELLLERVWGYTFATTSNSLDVYVGYLRRKLEAGGEPRLLHTVRGVGYVLRAP